MLTLTGRQNGWLYSRGTIEWNWRALDWSRQEQTIGILHKAIYLFVTGLIADRVITSRRSRSKHGQSLTLIGPWSRIHLSCLYRAAKQRRGRRLD